MKEVMNMNTETKFLVIDTETTNSIDDPFCYDVGFAVVDATGAVYESHSYVVADIFLDNELMASAYFAEKIPQYWDEIKSGNRQLRRFKTIRSILRDVVQQYGIRYIVAHNASFDYRSLNYTQRLLTSSKYRYFFPWGVEIWDTLKMARQVLGKDETYKQFCLDNGFTYGKEDKPQCRYTAEIIHRFLTGNLDFVEEHTGLEDVLIEKDILAFCLSKGLESGKLWE
jgi:DNA polymerase III epsilon subunit-like protein